MEAIHFGAGNIGRGFIGILLKNSNYDITFVDLNKEIIDSLKTDGKYTIYYMDEEGSSDTVSGVKGLHAHYDQQLVIESLVNCDLITTSLGQDNLKYIAQNIIEAIKLRYQKSSEKKLDIIACENGLKVSSFFKQLIYEKLTTELQQYADKYIGFVDCTVDRIVPNQVNDNVCDVRVEPGFEWVLSQPQVKVNNNIHDAQYTDDLAYYNKRKLLTVNLTHSLIGYIGYALGNTYVHETIADVEVEKFVLSVLEDIRNALVIEFGVEPSVQDQYALKTIGRFKNDKIVDELTRVARNPMTKLGNNERYISPLCTLIENNVDCFNLCTAIAYALAYSNPEEPQSIEIHSLIDELGIEQAIVQITGLKNEQVINKIASQYILINENKVATS